MVDFLDFFGACPVIEALPTFHVGLHGIDHRMELAILGLEKPLEVAIVVAQLLKRPSLQGHLALTVVNHWLLHEKRGVHLLPGRSDGRRNPSLLQGLFECVHPTKQDVQLLRQFPLTLHRERLRPPLHNSVLLLLPLYDLLKPLRHHPLNMPLHLPVIRLESVLNHTDIIVK